MGRTQIDFFSLDVEGAEEAILKSLPFDKVDIKLFIIEYLHDNKKIRAQRLDNLKRIFDKVGGYKFVGTHNDIDAMFQKIWCNWKNWEIYGCYSQSYLGWI